MKKILIVLTVSLLNITTGYAQDKDSKVKTLEKGIHLIVKDGTKPDVYIDGKKYDASIVHLLDQDKIAVVDVVKGKKAIEEYNAPNGVIIITSKEHMDSNGPIVNVQRHKIELRSNGTDDTLPMIIIDGKEWDRDKLLKLDPDDIESIEVVKGEAAIEKYDAPNGVILVVTKGKE